MEIADRLTEISFKDNRIIPNSPTFTYDPRYRLVGAAGQRHGSLPEKDKLCARAVAGSERLRTVFPALCI